MGKLVTILLFGIVAAMWLLTQVTSGWWTWVLSCLILYLMVVLPVLWTLSRILSLQDEHNLNRLAQRQSRHLPYSRILKQPSVPLAGPTVRKHSG